MAQKGAWQTVCPKREIIILVFALLIVSIFSVLYTTPKHVQIEDTTMLQLDWEVHGTTTVNPQQNTFDKDQVFHWSPDWLNRKDIGVMLNERKARIRKLCQLHPPSFGTENFTLLNRPGRYPHSQYSRSLTDPILWYCHTAKSGTQFIKNVLHEISDKSRFKKVSNGEDIFESCSFVTIRSPWHRLVSVYLEKFTDTEENASSKLLRYRLRFCNLSIRSIKERIPTFSEFLQHCILSTWNQNQMNIHWEPAVYRCKICSTNFDYIIATEHLTKELSYILQHEGIVKSARTFLENIRTKTIRPIERRKASSSFSDYYRNVSTADISTLRSLYHEEIHLLGYPDSPFTDSAYS